MSLQTPLLHGDARWEHAWLGWDHLTGLSDVTCRIPDYYLPFLMGQAAARRCGRHQKRSLSLPQCPLKLHTLLYLHDTVISRTPFTYACQMLQSNRFVLGCANLSVRQVANDLAGQSLVRGSVTLERPRPDLKQCRTPVAPQSFATHGCRALF